MKKNTYSSITTYDGLKGLRHRRSMYLGNPGLLDDGHAPSALNQTMQEVISNSIDEFLDGYGNVVDVTIHSDNSVTVKDTGRGMPKGANDTFNDVIASLTKPHSSGKFEGDGYGATGTAGMNGIGLKATNATSRYMELHAISHSTTFVNKDDEKPSLDGGYEEYVIRVEQENVVKAEIINKWRKNEVEAISENQFKTKDGEIITTGTSITYLPDDGPTFEEDDQPVFESIQWIVEDLYPRFNSSAFLNANLTIHFTDERVELQPTIDEDGKEIQPATKYLEKTWYYERGLEEYVEQLVEYQTLLSKFKKPISFSSEYEYDGMNFLMQASLIVTDDIDTNLKTYANGVPTRDGGPHLDGFKVGLTKAINEYAIDKGLNKIKISKNKTKKLDAFRSEDILEGLTGVFEIRIPAKIADFVGQTKEKLGTSQAKPVVNALTYKHVSDWLYDNEEAAAQMIEKIIESKAARDAAITARQAAKQARQNKGSVEQLVVLSKLEKATSNDPKVKELYIVEGDSASGGHRNTVTQGMLPLRGKIRNVEELSFSDALKNDEISTITSALGTGIGPAFNIDDLEYYKIILNLDSDFDGSHIALLLLTLFRKFFSQLIERGHLFITVPPLFKATKYVKGEPVVKYYYSDEEINGVKESLIKDGYNIQRFKGLGEMNDDEVTYALLDPKTRKIKRITIDDIDSLKRKLKILMGNDSNLRKEWVKENVDYDKLYEMI